jgi:putative oxidoreductase
MFEEMLPMLVFTGRVLLGGAFIFAGIRNLTNRPLLTSIMTARGVPQAGLLLWAGIALQIAAGALLISGFWTALAAAGLIAFLIAATVMFNNFWDHQGAERAARINGVVANVALAGGFILAMAAVR